MKLISRLFLLVGFLSFISSVIGGNPFFSIYIFGIEPSGWAIFSIICFVFAIALYLDRLTNTLQK